MQNKMSLIDLAQEIENIESEKNDFLVPTKDIKMWDDKELEFNTMAYEMNDNAHSQIASKLNIPKKYYDQMAQIPGLRTFNVNSWLDQSSGKHLVRTVGRKARAFLSDKFKPIDNALILNAFLPVVKEMNMQVKSCNLTDEKMYLQLIFPEIKQEVAVGDVVNLGITLSNSEVGRGAVDVSSLIYRLVCKNGMIGTSVLNKYHVGRRITEDFDGYNIFQEDTIQAELISFKKRLRDVLAAVCTDVFFEKSVNEMKIANGQEIENVQETVENVTQRYSMSQTEEKKIINNLVSGGKANRWGLVNSITALAHDIDDANRQYDVERIGYDLLTLKPAEWEKLTA